MNKEEEGIIKDGGKENGKGKLEINKEKHEKDQKAKEKKGRISDINMKKKQCSDSGSTQ